MEISFSKLPEIKLTDKIFRKQDVLLKSLNTRDEKSLNIDM